MNRPSDYRSIHFYQLEQKNAPHLFRLCLGSAHWRSGVATLTAAFVEAIRGTGAKILDTRKSDPRRLALVARLRRETTLSLKAIALRVGLGSSKSANATLHRWMVQ